MRLVAIPSPGAWLPGGIVLLLTLPVIAPLGAVAWPLLTPHAEIWAHLWATVLPMLLRNTAILALGVGVGTLVVGTGLAWLVSAYRFPGQRWFSVLLMLPMAVPGYVIAFVFLALFDFAGPVQTAWRQWLGPELDFPRLPSGAGVILVLTLTSYPYVYLLARAAFQNQAASLLDAARTLGYSRRRAFWRLLLPMARPALAAGATLAMLEAMTDIAAVRFYGFPTLSEGLLRIWEGMMDRSAALQLGVLLLATAFLVISLERLCRGRARYTQTQRPSRIVASLPLEGWRGWAASAVCGGILLAAFVLPVSQLLIWAIRELNAPSAGVLDGVLQAYLITTLGLAGGAALLAIIIALVLAESVRLAGGRGSRLLARLATLGYAVPGAVVGVGVLTILAMTDRLLNGVAPWLGFGGGLLLTGSLIGLFYGYLVRFMAVAYSSTDASLARITPQLGEVARTLGARAPRIGWRVHLPLLRGGLLAGATLVFVDVMKELPATLLLRPFGMDTLAIWTYMLAAESFWQAAAVPALLIVLSGLLPVFLLVRAGARSTHGG